VGAAARIFKCSPRIPLGIRIRLTHCGRTITQTIRHAAEIQRQRQRNHQQGPSQDTLAQDLLSGICQVLSAAKQLPLKWRRKSLDRWPERKTKNKGAAKESNKAGTTKP